MSITDADVREVETLLRDAAAKVEAATALLDLTTTPCPQCGDPLFDQWDAAKVRERVVGTAGRLRVAAARLRNTDHGAQVCGCQGGGRPTRR
jgi:hypothetical protein